MARKDLKHVAEYLHVPVRQLLEELIQASLDDIAGDHVKFEKLHDQFHVAMHLVLLAHFQLVVSKDTSHAIAKVLS